MKSEIRATWLFIGIGLMAFDMTNVFQVPRAEPEKVKRARKGRRPRGKHRTVRKMES